MVTIVDPFDSNQALDSHGNRLSAVRVVPVGVIANPHAPTVEEIAALKREPIFGYARIWPREEGDKE